MNFDKTRKLLDEFEKMPFDYDKSINKQIDIIKSILYGADNSGFSASCVGLGVIKETHSIEAPFMIINLDTLLYPQYGCPEKSVENFIEENKSWVGKQARKLLKESKDAHPDVIEHWKFLSKLRKKRKDIKLEEGEE